MLLISFLTICVVVNGAILPRNQTQCRCIVGDVCWPSQPQWNELNRTVEGRLIATVPLGSPCHDPHYEEAACNALKLGWPYAQTQ
jgi:hypothetical protein